MTILFAGEDQQTFVSYESFMSPSENQHLSPVPGTKLHNAAKKEKEALETTAITSALEKGKGKSEAKKGVAIILNILPTTLESKMKKYGISKYKFQRLTVQD